MVKEKIVSDDKNVITLFEKLEGLHNVVSRCNKVQKKFADIQKDQGVKVLSIKYCTLEFQEALLKSIFERNKTVMDVLEIFANDSTFDSKKKACCISGIYIIPQKFRRKNFGGKNFGGLLGFSAEKISAEKISASIFAEIFSCRNLFRRKSQ